MRKQLLIFVGILGAGSLFLPSAWSQQVIPLSLETIGNSQRLVIYAGINGGTAEPYLFDTGSSGFNAAYYNGPYSGPGSNPAAWTATSTLSTNATASYGTPSSGFSYVLNAVTVPSIQIYDKSNLLTPAINLVATAINPSSTGFVIGQVTDQTFNSGSPSSFQSNLAQGLAPLSSGLYGTFGASLFTGNVTSGSVPYVNSSVLGQSTTSGWAVVANTGTSSAKVILGLNSAIRNQFTSSVNWTATGADPYPNSGATGSTEFGGGKFDFELSGGGNPSVTWINGTLLDTGTQNNNLNARDSSSSDLGNYESSPPLVDAGYTITAAGNGVVTVSDTYGFTTTVGGLETYNANVKADAATNDHSTLGIGFFLADSVAFDLQNQQTLYTSNVVSVPEPGPIGLLGVAAIGCGIFIRRRADA